MRTKFLKKIFFPCCISAKEVANLMINGRNFQQLATIVPGVSITTGANSQVNAGYLGQTSLIVGGTSSEETTYTIDGVYNMTPTSLININITPSIDAINEFRVLKNAYSAKYGYAGSGQILIERIRVFRCGGRFALSWKFQYR